MAAENNNNDIMPLAPIKQISCLSMYNDSFNENQKNPFKEFIIYQTRKR